MAENALFEERLSVARRQTYAGYCAIPTPTEMDWREAHADYLNDRIFVAAPETFLAANSDAALIQPALPLGETQYLYRLESLDYAIMDRAIASLFDFERYLALYQGGPADPTTTVDVAKRKLEKLCELLNDNPFAERPRFATFAADVAEDVAAPDWANRLRDRLGLTHYPNDRIAGPHPVALMRFQIKEVAAQAAKAGVAHALAIPTFQDGDLNAYFHPAPREADYGRTIHLAGNADCEHLTSELLHLKIPYRPSHIAKIGAITTSPDRSDQRLVQLRADHLFCLRYTTDREDFGTL